MSRMAAYREEPCSDGWLVSSCTSCRAAASAVALSSALKSASSQLSISEAQALKAAWFRSLFRPRSRSSCRRHYHCVRC